MHKVLYMQCPEVENTEAVVNKNLFLMMSWRMVTENTLIMIQLKVGHSSDLVTFV